MFRRLVTCQGWVEWETILGNLGLEPSQEGPFAEAETDPQGSLRGLQAPPASSGSPTVPLHDSRRGSGTHGGTWRWAPQTPVSGGRRALVDN